MNLKQWLVQHFGFFTFDIGFELPRFGVRFFASNNWVIKKAYTWPSPLELERIKKEQAAGMICGYQETKRFSLGFFGVKINRFKKANHDPHHR